jgi:mannan endo-1,4-beta-mannosidase
MSDRLVGAFPGEDNAVANAKALDAWTGGALDVAVTFVRAGASRAERRAFVDHTLTPLWNAGFTPLVTWEPFSLVSGGESLAHAVRAGSTTRDWADTLAAWVAASPDDRSLFLRPAHEMNGSWYPWSAGAGVSPTAYVDFWTALRDVFDVHGPPADAVSWVWCPNADSAEDTDLTAYYPGDQCVDWASVDGYNFGASRQWSDWRSPAEIFKPAFEAVCGVSDRPLAVPEFGCSSAVPAGSDPARKSAWIADAFALFADAGVELAAYFDYDKETDWAVCTPERDVAVPETARVCDREYAVYPAFRRAAQRFRGDA